MDTALAPAALTALAVCRLGVVPYATAWRLQKAVLWERIEDRRPDTLLLLQHPPVFTLGRNSDDAHILVSHDELARRGATVERIERGGEVTYHGPGQLVAYPIIKLEGAERSIAWFVDRVEQTIIDTLGDYGIPGERLEDQRGVWARGHKIASVGLSVKRWVAMHGMALNVALDMSYFSLINPCGHPETVMTSMELQLGAPPSLDEVGETFLRNFARIFKRKPLAIDQSAALAPLLERAGA